MITLNLALKPEPKGRPRFSRQGHAYTPAKTRDYEKALKTLVRGMYKGKPMEGALIIEILFFLVPPKRKVRSWPTCVPDLDNLIKAVKDSANGILWKDDSQIVGMRSAKYYDWDKRTGRIEIKLEEMGNG